VLFSIGAAFRAQGSKVLYFAGYKKVIDRYKVAEIEAAADVSCGAATRTGVQAKRPQDRSFVGNIVQAMDAYALDAGPPSVSTKDADRLIAIGSDRMMAAVARAPRRAQRTTSSASLRRRSINSRCNACSRRSAPSACSRTATADRQEDLRVLLLQQDQDLDSVDFALSRSASSRIPFRRRSPRSGSGGACRRCAGNGRSCSD